MLDSYVKSDAFSKKGTRLDALSFMNFHVSGATAGEAFTSIRPFLDEEGKKLSRETVAPGEFGWASDGLALTHVPATPTNPESFHIIGNACVRTARKKQ